MINSYNTSALLNGICFNTQCVVGATQILPTALWDLFFMNKDSPVYNVWRSMKARCYYKNGTGYYLYGARGITVCDEWRNSFLEFHKFCLENKWEQGKQLDRIDNNLGYFPNNCRFVIPKENARNRRTNKYIEHEGIKLTYIGWAERLGIKKETFLGRIKKGLSIQEIINIGNRTRQDVAFNKRTSPVYNMKVGETIIVGTRKERDSIYTSGYSSGMRIKTRKIGGKYLLERIL